MHLRDLLETLGTIGGLLFLLSLAAPVVATTELYPFAAIVLLGVVGLVGRYVALYLHREYVAARRADGSG